MATLTVRNLPEDVHRALRMRAAQHGRSTEAEVRGILEDVVKPQERLRMGDALASIGRGLGLTDKDIEALALSREKAPAQPMRFD